VPHGPLPRFIALTLAWLPAMFAVWYLTAPVILWPVELIVDAVLRGGFGELVRSVAAQGSTIQVVSSLKPGQAVAGGSVIVDVNMLLYAFGLPMFAALVVAAHEPRWPRVLAIGYAVMLPFIAWGVVAEFLKNVAVTAGPLVTSQAGFSATQREAIVFAFQFGSLILPTVVPAAIWVLSHRAFLERLRAQSLEAR
jgi:hypothetical protein